MRPLARAAVLAGYTVAFWLALPALLWRAARGLDRAAGWAAAPWPGGAAILASGLALIGWAALELWRGGKGLPVSALPPPRFTRCGPYAYVRHPIYLGFTVLVFGAGLLVGSRALAWVVAPLFVPVWIAYARWEERGLARRFGAVYRRYRHQVGLLPRINLYPVARLLQAFHALPVQVAGREHVPRRGPAILVWNHASYLDPVYVGVTTPRDVHFLTTAEAYRRGLLAWVVGHFRNVPVRRYRPDPAACREMIRRLAEGAVVGVAPEGERSLLGDYQGARPDVAAILARTGVPVVPVGVSGNYDCGPRWADALRRRPVRVRVGPPVRFDPATPPERTIDTGIRALLATEAQPVCLDGLAPERIARVLWRCPRCGDEPAWHAAALHCGACGARFSGTPEGVLRDEAGAAHSLAALGRAVREWPETAPLAARVTGWREAAMFGPIRPLAPLGAGELRADREALDFGELRIAYAAIRTTSTERADTLQIATRDAMWQFRFAAGSAFRFQGAVDRWRGAGGV